MQFNFEYSHHMQCNSTLTVSLHNIYLYTYIYIHIYLYTYVFIYCTCEAASVSEACQVSPTHIASLGDYPVVHLLVDFTEIAFEIPTDSSPPDEAIQRPSSYTIVRSTKSASCMFQLALPPMAVFSSINCFTRSDDSVLQQDIFVATWKSLDVSLLSSKSIRSTYALNAPLYSLTFGFTNTAYNIFLLLLSIIIINYYYFEYNYF